jgi:hypothetical protein
LIKSDNREESVETLGLIDSGAGGKFIDQNYARNSGFRIQKLDKPLKALNVDGTENKQGKITSFVDLQLDINGRKTETRLFVTGLGKQRIILGFPWLNEHNPDINWKTGQFTWRTTNPEQRRFLKIKRKLAQQALEPKKAPPRPTMVEEIDEDEELNRTRNPALENDVLLAYMDDIEENNEVWINAKTSNSIEFHLQHDEKKDNLPLEEQIPKEYHEYLDVFDENKADRFPESSPWDHKIELKEGFQPKSFKTYNLTPEEQTELDKFLKENLEKGYIRPSQSPMASPFFFVKKKDGKLRPCQDYRYLNDWTIKNAYPLPLISEIMDKLKGSQYFTKLDIRWGYNNIRIKGGDEWKAAFKTN